MGEDIAGGVPWGRSEDLPAWAGVGDGVLSHDAGGDGQITQDREFVFTEWDPTARDDRTALRAWSEVSELERLRGVRDIKGLRNGIQLALTNGRGRGAMVAHGEMSSCAAL
jgi:hypothetical protein